LKSPENYRAKEKKQNEKHGRRRRRMMIIEMLSWLNQAARQARQKLEQIGKF
jgi:hypothetical protein